MKKNKKYIPDLSPDASELIRALEADTAKEIEKIRMMTKQEMLKIEKSYNESIEEFRKKITDEFKAREEKEKQKLLNRASIEKINTQLNSQESFMDFIINQLISELRTDYREEYHKFLSDGISQVISDSNDSLEFLCYPDDIEMLKKILSSFNDYTEEKKIILKEDPELYTGGIIINSLDSPVTYNMSLERLIYRRKRDIRNELTSLNKRGIKYE